jgi:phosphonate transport system substrate-binding protein
MNWLGASCFSVLVLSLTLVPSSSASAAEVYSFGVVSQRGAVPTAQYWNPILAYVRKQTGVTLNLKLARTGAESKDATEKGEYDFVYSNHFFQPAMATAGYQVILRPVDEAIRGQIVTLDSSPIKTLKDLEGKEVGFPSVAAFVGYAVPMDQILRRKVKVTPIFGGNQEGIMGQLKAGRIPAAGVNSQVMATFAAREGFKYRVLWESEAFYNVPIAAHPRVPKTVVDAVRTAFDAMDDNPQGRQVLEASAKAVGQTPPYGFKASSDVEYKNQIDFYKNTLVKDVR